MPLRLFYFFHGNLINDKELRALSLFLAYLWCQKMKAAVHLFFPIFC